jgi:hypothetical protein
MTNHDTPYTGRMVRATVQMIQDRPRIVRTKFVPTCSIERTIHAHLVADFGAGADLSDVTLADIEDSIIIALMDAGRGGVEECREQAERLAARVDGMVL